MASSIIAGFIVGIWFLSLWPWGWVIPVAGLLVAGSLLLLKQPKVLILFLLGSALGAGRMQLVPGPNPLLEARVGEKVTISGHIFDDPSATEFATRLVIGTASGDKIIAYAPPYSGLKLGEPVQASGELRRPESFLTPVKNGC